MVKEAPGLVGQLTQNSLMDWIIYGLVPGCHFIARHYLNQWADILRRHTVHVLKIHDFIEKNIPELIIRYIAIMLSDYTLSLNQYCPVLWLS